MLRWLGKITDVNHKRMLVDSMKIRFLTKGDVK
jgi:hypothetical protein